MDFVPKLVPLYGGQRLDITFNQDYLDLDTIEASSDKKLFLHLCGTNTCHLTNVIVKKTKLFTFIPENDIVELKELTLYLATLRDDYTVSKLELMATSYIFLEYFDDSITFYSTILAERFLNNLPVLNYLDELYSKSLGFLTTDEALENFDAKLSIFIGNACQKIIEENNHRQEPLALYALPGKSPILDEQLMKSLDLKCLSKTKEIFMKIARKEEPDNDVQNFLYDLSYENMRGRYMHAVFVKEFSNCGVSYLSYTTCNKDYTICDQIDTLMEFVRETTGEHKAFEDLNLHKNRSKTIRVKKDSATDIKEESLPRASVTIRIDEEINTITHLEEERILPKKLEDSVNKRSSLKKASTFKGALVNTPTIKLTDNIPARSSSDTVKNKPPFIQTKISRINNSEESGISSQSGSLHPGSCSSVSKKLTHSKTESTSHFMKSKFSTNQTKSQKKGKEETPRKESISEMDNDEPIHFTDFLNQQIEDIKNDPSFRPSTTISAKHDEQNKSKKIKGVISSVFKRSKSATREEKKNEKSKILLNINKGTCSSMANMGNKEKLGDTLALPKTAGATSDDCLVSGAGSPEDLEIDDIFNNSDSWSATADHKILKKMGPREIKRQDIIYELVKTEYNYVKTLKTMHKVYFNGLLSRLNLPRPTVEKLVPKIVDLIVIHGPFLASLMQLRNQSEHCIIHNIGDVLHAQFTGDTAKRVEETYGFICSNQNEASECYKELLNHRKFAEFVRVCSNYSYLRRLTIPECQTFLSQRVVKYPMLIEALLKNTKDNDKDHAKLAEVLAHSREVVKNVNIIVKGSEMSRQLKVFVDKSDTKSEAIYYGNKYKIGEIFANAELLKTANVRLKQKTKILDVMIVALDKFVVILNDNGDKYTFANIEQKSPILSYRELTTRVAATDIRSLYVLDKFHTEIYEFAFKDEKESLSWLTLFNDMPKVKEKSTGGISTPFEPPDFLKLQTKLFEDLETLGAKVFDLHNGIMNAMTSQAQDLAKKISDPIIPGDRPSTTAFYSQGNKTEERKILAVLKELLKKKNTVFAHPTLKTPASPVEKGNRARTRTVATPSPSDGSPISIRSKESSLTRDSPTLFLKGSMKLKSEIDNLTVLLNTEEYFCVSLKSKISGLHPRKLTPKYETFCSTLLAQNVQLSTTIKELKKCLNNILTDDQYNFLFGDRKITDKIIFAIAGLHKKLSFDEGSNEEQLTTSIP